VTPGELSPRRSRFADLSVVVLESQTVVRGGYQRYEFGFLREDRDIIFEGGVVRRLSTYDEAAKQFSEATNEDRYIYPRIQATGRPADDPEAGQEGRLVEVPKTRRPALMFALPISHSLEIDEPPIEGDFLRNDGAFLMHLLAYLFGARLQFKDWYVDGRILAENPWLITTPESESKFLSHCYSTWKKWEKTSQRSMINILFMNSKSPCHEWDWERFMINYMVFDALFKLAQNLEFVSKLKRRKHEERYDAMQEAFQLAPDIRSRPSDSLSIFRTMAKLRNNLFHEALWDQTSPGGSVSETARFSVQWLRRINQRIIPAILGFETRYTHVSFTALDPCVLSTDDLSDSVFT
jgi:hypothetical protein